MYKYKKLSAIMLIVALVTGLMMFSACGAKNESAESSNQEAAEQQQSVSLEDKSFEELAEMAKGSTVNFYGWGGDDKRNEWIDNYIGKRMKEKYDITINRVGMDIDELMNLLLTEKNSGKEGEVDVVWINGENFANAKKNGFLYGPFTQKLPNFQNYVDGESNDVKYDFSEPTEGLEAPYGKAQFVFMYDSAVIENPPKDHKELLELAKANPGKITYAALPDFTGSVFVRNIISDIQGYQDFMNKDLTKEELSQMLVPSMDYLKELKPYLWKKGETYPPDNPTLTNMFADKEVILAMTYNPNTASTMIAESKVPNTVRTFVFDKGNVGNTHFLAISEMSANKAGAMMFINEILSPEAQISKADPNILGDMPVISYEKLDDEMKKLYDAIPRGEATLPSKEIEEHRIPEMPAQIVPIIEKIWEENIVN